MVPWITPQRKEAKNLLERQLHSQVQSLLDISSQNILKIQQLLYKSFQPQKPIKSSPPSKSQWAAQSDGRSVQRGFVRPFDHRCRFFLNYPPRSSNNNRPETQFLEGTLFKIIEFPSKENTIQETRLPESYTWVRRMAGMSGVSITGCRGALWFASLVNCSQSWGNTALSWWNIG